MKKLLHFMMLFFVIGISNSQTPIYQFNFDGNLSDTSNTATFAIAGAPVNYFTDRNGISNSVANVSLRILTASLPNLPQGNSARTISFWAKTTYVQSQPTNFLCAYGTPSSNSGFGYYESYTSPTGSQGVNYTFNATTNLQKGSTPNNDAWHHYVIIHGYGGSANTGAVFFDGVLQNTINRPTSLTTAGTSFIIGQELGGNASISGLYDDLKIYATALTDAQVTTLFTGTSPVITNTSATAVTNNSATINYTVNAFSQNVTRQLFYNYGGEPITATTPIAFTNSTPTAYNNVLTGLIQNRRYNCNIAIPITGNSSVFPGTGNVTFTTTGSLPVPTVSTVSLGSITQTSAVLSYNFNPNGNAISTAGIIYTNTVNNTITTVLGAFEVTGTTALPYTKSLTGLAPNTLYSYEIYGSNASGESQPITGTFTTASATPAPVITNVGSSNVSFSSATINFNLNTNNLSATYQVQYGLSNDLLTTLGTVTGGPTTNNAPTATSVNLTGLQPNKSYWIKVLSTSSSGTTTDFQYFFTTLNPYDVSNLSFGTVTSSGATINYTANTNNLVGTLNILVQVGSTYDAENGTNIIVLDNTNFVSNGNNNFSYVISTLNPNTTYSYSVQLGGFGTGVFVIANSPFTTTAAISAAPTATATQTVCNGATVADLFATGTNLKWYTSATGGTQLATSTTLVQGLYFVSQTQTGLTESTRTVVSVTVNLVTAPNAVAQTFCNSGTVADLVGTGTNLKWYTTATGGSPLSNVASLSTATYYVSQTVNACESSRTSVNVTVYQIGPPSAIANQSFCTGATLADVQFNIGTNLKWYSTATGTTLIPNTTVMSTGTYYVTQTFDSCESTTRATVNVTVNTTSSPTGNATQTFVTGQTVANLVASGINVVWFSSAANANANTNPLASNTVLVSGTIYYAMQTVNGCRSTTPLAVSVTVTLSTADFNTNLKVSMYPNPATDILNIDLESELQSVEFYSLQGQKVLTSNLKEINVSSLASGLYMVRVENVDGAIATKKLIIK